MTHEKQPQPDQPNPQPIDYDADIFKQSLPDLAPGYRLIDIHDLDRAPIYRGPDFDEAKLRDIIEGKLARLPAVHVEHAGVWDATTARPAEIVALLDELTASANLLLHGGKAELENGQLDPSKSRQQDFGKTAAVNATTDAQTAAYYASFDFAKFSKYLPAGNHNLNFGIGLNNYGYEQAPERSFQLQADHVSYPLWLEHCASPNFYSNGFIYLLNRANFKPSSITPGQQRSDHEWSTDSPARPLAIIKVSGSSLGPTIISPDKLVQNSH